MSRAPTVVTSQTAVAPELDLADEQLLGRGSLQLIRRAGLALMVQMVGAGIAYAVQVTLARLLGTSHYGIYSYVFVWASFASLVAGLGFPYASVRFLPVYRVNQDWPRLLGFVRATTRMTFATGFALVVLGIGVAEALHATGVLAQSGYVALGAMVAATLAVSTLYQEIARAGGRVGMAFAPGLIARPALTGLGAAGLFVVGGSLSATAALGTTVIAGCAVIAAQYLLTRHLFAAPVKDQRPILELREWLGVGVSLLAAGAFTVTLMQVDIVVVGAFRGSYDAGLYSAASKTATLVAFVIMAVNAASAPRFSALWALGRVEDLQRLLDKLAVVIFWPSLAIAAGVAALATPLLSLFGPDFTQARGVLLILLVGQVVNAGAGSVGYLLNLTGHHRDAAWALGWSAVACVVAALIGVWALGMIGAAIASTLGLLLWNGWLYWLVVRKLGVHPAILRPHHLARVRRRARGGPSDRASDRRKDVS